MIETMLAQGASRQEIVKALLDNKMAPDEVTAEFMIDIVMGVTDGDAVEVDAKGNEVKRIHTLVD